MKVRTQTRQFLMALAYLVVFLGIASLAQSLLLSNNDSASSEAGFISFSPRGVSGGSIIPASCESGLGQGGTAHFGGDTSGNCYVRNACAPNPNPSGYGSHCTSSPNACGQTRSNGIIQCNGSCSSTPPPNPGNYGNTCVSAPNSCGQTSSGITGCNNSCSATTPPETDCTSTATLSASPTVIDQGQSSTLTWSSTNATSCTGTGFTAGGSSGTRSTGALNTPGTSNYQVVCTGTGGTSAPAFASVEVLSPSVSISASPTRVQTGTNSQISWSASQVNSCAISGPGLSSTSISGSQSVPISAQSIYTITCQTNGSPITKSVTVNVVAIFTEF